VYELSEDRNDSSIDWLYGQAAKYPLLSAEQEKYFDGKKWSAAKALQSLMLEDRGATAFLSLWASNVLNNPPSLATFPNKEYYFLLRREQSKYLKSAAFKPFQTRNITSSCGVNSQNTSSLQPSNRTW
jgi:hypothetical protein